MPHRSGDVDDCDLDLLKDVITRDESLVYGYDIETKAKKSVLSHLASLL